MKPTAESLVRSPTPPEASAIACATQAVIGAQEKLTSADRAERAALAAYVTARDARVAAERALSRAEAARDQTAHAAGQYAHDVIGGIRRRGLLSSGERTLAVGEDGCGVILLAGTGERRRSVVDHLGRNSVGIALADGPGRWFYNGAVYLEAA